jgi:hypothetical protein
VFPVSTRLLSDDRETLVFGLARSGVPGSKRFTGTHAHTPVHEILEVLFAEKKGILYVEGGAGVLRAISSGLVTGMKFASSKTPGILGGGVKAPSLPEGAASFSDFMLGPDR